MLLNICSFCNLYRYSSPEVLSAAPELPYAYARSLSPLSIGKSGLLALIILTLVDGRPACGRSGEMLDLRTGLWPPVALTLLKEYSSGV